MMRRSVSFGVLAVLGASLFSFAFTGHAHAAPAPADSAFSVQVTPSPLVSTVKPGQTTQLELKIRNAGDQPQDLKIEPRSFKLNNEQVQLDDTSPPDIGNWISFSQPKFTTQPGEWTTEQVRLAVPKDAGFSYSFALVISRQSDPKPTEGGRLIKGSVAIFTLINVDKPGATRKLDVAQFVSTKKMYEYLPSKLSVRLKNSGNTIVQPYGNIYIQRGGSSQSPLATLAVNENKGYILPGTVRTLKSEWNDGFPSYQNYTTPDGSQKQRLAWNWSKLSDLRIGHYTAKLVAVYNDGQHDIPIQGEVSFWVLPWKILLGLLVFVLLILVGLWSFVRKIISFSRRGKHSSRR